MKTKKLILNILPLFLLLFCLVFLGTGCDDDRDPLCYKGKVVSLNNGNGCYNIIEILNNINDDKLHVGTTITFDPELYEKRLKEGDIVYFKIIQYAEWVGPGYANCLWPKFTAQIEFCIN